LCAHDPHHDRSHRRNCHAHPDRCLRHRRRSRSFVRRRRHPGDRLRRPLSTPGDAVTLKLIAFTPTRLEVAAGSTVTWRQDDVASHGDLRPGRSSRRDGHRSAGRRFDPGTISKGQNFRFRFSEPGEYPFFCAVHPATMTGVVTVK
jgi:plastocyanin